MASVIVMVDFVSVFAIIAFVVVIVDGCVSNHFYECQCRCYHNFFAFVIVVTVAGVMIIFAAVRQG